MAGGLAVPFSLNRVFCPLELACEQTRFYTDNIEGARGNQIPLRYPHDRQQEECRCGRPSIVERLAQLVDNEPDMGNGETESEGCDHPIHNRRYITIVVSLRRITPGGEIYLVAGNRVSLSAHFLGYGS